MYAYYVNSKTLAQRSFNFTGNPNTKIQTIDKKKYDRNSYPVSRDTKEIKNPCSKPEACVLSDSNGTCTSKLRIVVLIQNPNLQVKFDCVRASSLTLHAVNTFELPPMKQKCLLKKKLKR